MSVVTHLQPHLTFHVTLRFCFVRCFFRNTYRTKTTMLSDEHLNGLTFSLNLNHSFVSYNLKRVQLTLKHFLKTRATTSFIQYDLVTSEIDIYIYDVTVDSVALMFLTHSQT